jgi:hypothetical protein
MLYDSEKKTVRKITPHLHCKPGSKIRLGTQGHPQLLGLENNNAAELPMADAWHVAKAFLRLSMKIFAAC